MAEVVVGLRNLAGMIEVGMAILRGEMLRAEVADLFGLPVGSISVTIEVDTPPDTIIADYAEEKFDTICGSGWTLPDEFPYDPDTVDLEVYVNEPNGDPAAATEDYVVTGFIDLLKDQLGPDNVEVIDLDELLGLA